MTWKITASECSTYSLSTFIMCLVGKATIYIPRLRHKLILKVFPLMFRCDGHLTFQKAKSVKRKSINTSTETRTYHKRRSCQRWNCCCCQNFCTYQGWHIWWRFVAAVAASVAAENIAPSCWCHNTTTDDVWSVNTTMNPTMQAPPSYSTSSMNHFSKQPQFAAPNTKPITTMTHRSTASVTPEKHALAQKQKTINHQNRQRQVCEQERLPGTSSS
ncbi:hypothetical protein L5515_019564 [Caenorhabditis briggsae]|uniref:Uncharacterized protein n=1 Tax=Caenorhabditis briggsae TaxID=6238 RepID=A0AAE9JTB8_CAEBR|nr:hypothetical protein L5515_019564 [Caenorhabditis briggsae]